MRGKKLLELECPIFALASFDKAAELGLDSPPLHLDRAKLLITLYRPEEALIPVDRVIAEGYNLGMAYTTKAGALHDLKRYEEAIDACDKAIQFDPNIAFSHIYRGFSIIAIDPENAVEPLHSFERAVEIDPSIAVAHTGLAMALLGLDRDDELLAALNEALRLGYDDKEVIAMFESGLEGEARRELHKIMESHGVSLDNNQIDE